MCFGDDEHGGCPQETNDVIAGILPTQVKDDLGSTNMLFNLP